MGGTGDGFGWFVLLGVVALACVVLGAVVIDSTRLARAAVPTPDPTDDDR